jgi:hypothetical protein
MATLTTIAKLTGPQGDTGAPGDPTAYELRGTGSPQGVVTASPGTYYTDSAGTLGAWRWLKTSGAGNTGWVVVEGDTGWYRVVDAGSIADASALTVAVKRVNGEVHVRLQQASGGTTALSGITTLWTPPAGLDMSQHYAGTAPIYAAQTWTEGIARIDGSSLYIAGNTPLRLIPKVGVRHYATLTYAAADGWITVAPGTLL